jgi:hypothetical protein
MSENNVNLDSLLDATLDDLADLPEFAPYPAGAHKVTIELESKEVNKHPSIELKLKAIETLELADPTNSQPLAAGAESGVLFMLDNEFAQGNMKKVLRPLQEHLGVSSLRDIITQSKGMEVTVVTNVRWNKDKTQAYTNVTKIII